MNTNNDNMTHKYGRRFHRDQILSTAVFVGLIAAVVAYANQPMTTASPSTVESLFPSTERPQPVRLTSAREAAKHGDWELAIYDYRASIQEDPTTADTAITVLVKIFLSRAEAHGGRDCYVDESAQINRCYQTLIQIKQTDAVTKMLPEQARVTLFKEMSHVRSVGNERAKGHIIAADRLRHKAKGIFNDDENEQAKVLHRVNLAWSYYPSFTDEWMVSKMYEIWADMKGELPTWQYNRVMEVDRLQLGRVIGDRS